MVSKRTDKILRIGQWLAVSAFIAAGLAMLASIPVPVILTASTIAGIILLPLIRFWLRDKVQQENNR